MSKEISKSKATAIKTIYKCFQLIKEAGGEMSRKELLTQMTKSLDFTKYELERLESNGQARWLTVFLFYSVDCNKAGFLLKNKGTWVLTPEGINAMKLGPEGLVNKASDEYKKWNNAKKKSNQDIPDVELNDDKQTTEKKDIVNIEVLSEQAQDGIIDFINSKNPYEFQDLIAKLLETMGYFIDFVAPKGKDGGIDIIAYQDILGIKKPRIKVQVKHYPKNPIGPDPIRSLKGLLNSEDDIGLFVTSGSFTSEAKRTARDSNIHIRLMDGNEIIELWQNNYSKMNDEDKSLLPLHTIYFLRAND